jgi:hypothetical protein
MRIEATFVRHAGERDRVHARRADGTEVSWAFPTYGDWLPHDLVHLVVERAFRIADGFWGRVAGGMDPKRQPLMDDPALLVAEALANAQWPLAELTDAERAQLIKDTAGLDVSVEQVRAIRLELLSLADRWRELVPKGAITETFAL